MTMTTTMTQVPIQSLKTLIKLGKLKIRGNYKLATEFMRRKENYTKTDIINFYMDQLGKDYKASCGSATILLSPRKVSKHGDPRGNASNPWGHLAYNEKIKRKEDPITGDKEEQRYMFQFRDIPLEKKHHTYYRRKLKQEKEITITTGKSKVKAKNTNTVSEVSEVSEVTS